MIPFHTFFPELAQREVRCLHLGPDPEAGSLPADEYVYLEHYCEELGCDCRRVFIEVISREQPGRIFASINYGWEKESFYRKRMPYDSDAALSVTRGELDPINEQSEFAEVLLELFRTRVLDEPYRLRLRRHYRVFKEELARRGRLPGDAPAGPLPGGGRD